MPMLIGIIVCVFLIILRELEKSDTRRILYKAKDMSFINKELESIQRKRQSNRELSMTREEEINNAKEVFYRKILQEGTYYDPRDCFEEGAEWADNHPKSPWISVKDDLPCNHSDLVLTYNDIPFSTKRVLVMTDIHTLFLCDMKKDNGRGWIWNYLTKDKITHWMPIPEPPKE